VPQLEIKVLNINDARCNHEVSLQFCQYFNKAAIDHVAGSVAGFSIHMHSLQRWSSRNITNGLAVSGWFNTDPAFWS